MTAWPPTRAWTPAAPGCGSVCTLVRTWTVERSLWAPGSSLSSPWPLASSAWTWPACWRQSDDGKGGRRLFFSVRTVKDGRSMDAKIRRVARSPGRLSLAAVYFRFVDMTIVDGDGEEDVTRMFRWELKNNVRKKCTHCR